MPDKAHAHWPGRVAVAVLRTDPPEVYLASDPEVLGRVLAMKLVATTDASTVPPKELAHIQRALLDEQWAEALGVWIGVTGIIIDAYPDDQIWTDALLDVDEATFEMKLAPIFDDDQLGE